MRVASYILFVPIGIMSGVILQALLGTMPAWIGIVALVVLVACAATFTTAQGE